MLRVAILLLGVTACAASPTPARPDLGCATLAAEPCPIRHEAIQSVEPLYSTTNGKAGPTNRLRGASVVILAEPAMTKELLERTTSCRCPFASGSTIAVESTFGTYRIEIRANDDDDANALLSRMRAM